MPPNKTDRSKTGLSTLLGAVIVAFFMLNPETLELALFINAVGFDIYLMLLEIQLLTLGGLFVQYGIRPIANFFLGFSMHPIIAPGWNEIRRHPSSLTHLLPPGAILMLALTALLGFGLFGQIKGQGFLLIDLF